MPRKDPSPLGSGAKGEDVSRHKNQIFHINMVYDFVVEATSEEEAEREARFLMRSDMYDPPTDISALPITSFDDLPPGYDANTLVYTTKLGPERKVGSFIRTPTAWEDIEASLRREGLPVPPESLPVPPESEFATYYLSRLASSYASVDVFTEDKGKSWTIVVSDPELEDPLPMSQTRPVRAKTVRQAVGEACVLVIQFERKNGLRRFLPAGDEETFDPFWRDRVREVNSYLNVFCNTEEDP